MNQVTLLASEKQFEAIKIFFDTKTEDILYGGAARGGKSETIGMLLAICIAAFPGSHWFLGRTGLADLKATTLSTFFSVLKRFGYGEQSYRDKVRDERNIDFRNGSKLFVMGVNYEPSDPEFDRIGSYGYTGAFLDEGQQMSNKVREVLQGRLSNLSGSFETEVPKIYENYDISKMQVGYTINFKIVKRVEKEKPGVGVEYELFNGSYCVIDREERLFIPYKIIRAYKKGDKLIHEYRWEFKGCIFTSCNPGTNFTKTEFYIPWKKGELPSYMAFIPARVNDNPWVDKKYIERLERLPENSVRKQRLLYGNFEYDDDPGLLYDQNTIMQMFTKTEEEIKELEKGDKYIIVDAARQGKDNTEIGIWFGLHLKEIITIKKGDFNMQAEKIERLRLKYNIDIDNVLVDEVGAGQGLVDMLGCKGFIGNSQAIHPYEAKFLPYKKRNYANLRTQCFYYLQKYINRIAITCNDDLKEQILIELGSIKEKNVDLDGKMQIISKKEIKEQIGKSPDLADMISMRMYYIIKQHKYSAKAQEDIIQNEEQEITKTALDIAVEKMLQEIERPKHNNNTSLVLDVF